MGLPTLGHGGEQAIAVWSKSTWKTEARETGRDRQDMPWRAKESQAGQGRQARQTGKPDLRAGYD